MRPPHPDTELAVLGEAVRRLYVEAPPAAVAERHVAAMLAEAGRVAASDAAPRPEAGRALRRRGVPVLRLASVIGAAFVATAGMAVAGVRPPEPFSDLYEAVGFDVPGTDGDDSDSDAKKAGNRNGRGDHDSSKPAQAQPTAGSASQGSASDEPGRRQGQQPGHPSAEGQETAQQAQSGQTPPTDPGRSEDHPVPQGTDPGETGASAHSSSPAVPPAGSTSQGTAPTDPSASAPGRTGGPVATPDADIGGAADEVRGNPHG
jgi:hypothetical protein